MSNSDENLVCLIILCYIKNTIVITVFFVIFQTPGRKTQEIRTNAVPREYAVPAGAEGVGFTTKVLQKWVYILVM